MLPTRSLLISTTAVWVLLLPKPGFADEAHSWCVPGLPRLPNGSPVESVNQVVNHVCGQTGFGSCCDPSKGHWTLACIQAGADWAKTQNGLGDICGRYAWSSGTLAGSSQVYPRDFSLVTLGDVDASGRSFGGNASGFRDTAGGILAYGDVSPATGFAINGGSKGLPLAIFSNGNVTLKSGTVYGETDYVGSYTNNGGVTYADGGAAHHTGSYINIAALRSSLKDMSTALSAYYSTPAKLNYSTLAFTPPSPDPELNVFSATADQVQNAATFSFALPPGSTAIINVTGTAVNFKSAGFNFVSAPSYTKILWNFPDAQTVSLLNMTFPGSMLAPKARATMQNGAFNGTAVVKETAEADVEWHWYPYQGATCSKGCLCWDTTWSCSQDTYIDDSGSVAFPAAEAGFLEIAGGDYLAEGVNRVSPTHRIFYSFQPATSQADKKPTVVFFNGGPGNATSSALFAFNTAPFTLDPAVASTAKVVANKYPWTDYANLLYIDSPGAGFSYPMSPYANNQQVDIGIDIDRDAGVFLQVITRFLVRHPKLLPNRVIIAGESYGGTRATLMLNYLYHYSQLANSSVPYQDALLLADLYAYFSAAFATQYPTTAQITSRFGHQALIEPVVVGDNQQNDSHPELLDCNSAPTTMCKDGSYLKECWTSCADINSRTVSPTCDQYNCKQAKGWENGQIGLAADSLTTVAILNQVLGVDAKTIEWMKASSRTLSYGRDLSRNNGLQHDTDMSTTFGPLQGTEQYYLTANLGISDGYGCAPDSRYVCTGTVSRQWQAAGIDIGKRFLENMAIGAKTFITRTTLDALVRSEAIAVALNDPIFNIWNVDYNPTSWSGISARPGVMTVTYSSGHVPGTTVRVQMPTYAAGHHITMVQDVAGQLRSDVMTAFY